MSEKFCLKWNDFQTNVTNSFKQLRKSDDFYDVTLVSDDKQQVSAHKIVLASSSEYFKDVLKNNKHSHPLLCLNGVNSQELNFVLDYMYNGEVQIYQEHLDGFLEIAQRFQVEGLMQKEGGQSEVDSKLKNEPFSERTEVYQDEKSSDLQLVNKVYDNARNSNPREKIISLHSSDFNSIEEVDQQIETMIERQLDGNYRCQPCGRISNKRSNAKEHAETHIDGMSFPCQYCDKSFRSRPSHRDHVSKKCPQRPSARY